MSNIKIKIRLEDQFGDSPKLTAYTHFESPEDLESFEEDKDCVKVVNMMLKSIEDIILHLDPKDHDFTCPDLGADICLYRDYHSQNDQMDIWILANEQKDIIGGGAALTYNIAKSVYQSFNDR